jgi:hypothetical protein
MSGHRERGWKFGRLPRLEERRGLAFTLPDFEAHSMEFCRPGRNVRLEIHSIGRLRGRDALAASVT